MYYLCLNLGGFCAGECGGNLRKLAAGDGRRLKVLAADPFDYQSIVDAVRGCSGLFYTFDPPQGQTYDVSARRISI